MSYTTWDIYMTQTTGREPSLSPDKISTGNEPMLSQVQQNIMYLKYCLAKIDTDDPPIVDKEMVDRIIRIISQTHCSVSDAVTVLVHVLSLEVQIHPYLDDQQWETIIEKTIKHIRQEQLQMKDHRRIREGLVESLLDVFAVRKDIQRGR